MNWKDRAKSSLNVYTEIWKIQRIGFNTYRPAVNGCFASLHPWYMFLSCCLIKKTNKKKQLYGLCFGCNVQLEDGCWKWCVPPAINLYGATKLPAIMDLNSNSSLLTPNNLWSAKAAGSSQAVQTAGSDKSDWLVHEGKTLFKTVLAKQCADKKTHEWWKKKKNRKEKLSTEHVNKIMFWFSFLSLYIFEFLLSTSCFHQRVVKVFA